MEVQMSNRGDNSSGVEGKRGDRTWSLLRSDTTFLAFFKQKKLASDQQERLKKYRENEREKKRAKYNSICSKLHVIPIRSYLRNIDDSKVNLKGRLLRTNELRAVCTMLKGDNKVSYIDLSETFLQNRSCGCLCALLRANRYITTLILQKCSLNGYSLTLLGDAIKNCPVTSLDLSGNAIADKDNGSIANLITNCRQLRTFSLRSNCIAEHSMKLLGSCLGKNKSIEDLDLSWNHIRRKGAIEISKGIQSNAHIINLVLSWNGFGFEGCVALSEMLQYNITLTKLDLASNRIHPPAMLELMKGLYQNKNLIELDLSLNPITPMFTCVLLDGILKTPTMALRKLIMENSEKEQATFDLNQILIDLGFSLRIRRSLRKDADCRNIGERLKKEKPKSCDDLYLISLCQKACKRVVVNEDFLYILETIKSKRDFTVIYELSLPVGGYSIDKMKQEVEAPSVFNLNPLHLLYTLKEKYRAQDFFNKINKDQNDVVTADELSQLFHEAGVPVTKIVIEKIMDFMDTNNDGTIDISEFLEGDRKIRKISRGQIKENQKLEQENRNYNKYSRSFRRGQIDPMTYRLTVSKSPTTLPVIESRGPSPQQQGQDNAKENRT